MVAHDIDARTLDLLRAECRHWASRLRNVDADELLSEVWLRWRGNVDGPVWWVRHAARCRIIEYLRMLFGRSDRRSLPKKRQIGTRYIEEMEWLQPHDSGAYKSVDDKEAVAWLLKKTPLIREEHELIKLYYYDGLTQEVIAERLHVGKATVSLRLKNIRKAMAETAAQAGMI